MKITSTLAVAGAGTITITLSGADTLTLPGSGAVARYYFLMGGWWEG